MLLDLIHNIALLVMLVMLIQSFTQRMDERKLTSQAIIGLLFGGIGILGMMSPVQFVPGVICDSRVIIVALAGLFGGLVPLLIAAAMMLGYRLHLGGAGVWVGSAVVFQGAALGLLHRYMRKQGERWVGTAGLLIFGFVASAGMLVLQSFLPEGRGWEVLSQIGVPVMIIYPLGYMLAARFFLEGERRRASVSALAHSEERYRSLFQNHHAVMLLIDPESGCVVDANPAATAFYGWTRAELQGKPLGEIDTLPAKELEARVEAVRLQRTARFEVKHRRADGTVVDVEVFAGPISAEGRTLLLSIVHDVSARHRAEASLRASESLQRAMIACTPVALYSIDAEGSVLLWNTTAEQVFGWTADEVLGRPFPAVPPELETEHREWRRRFAEGERFQSREVVRLRKDGSRFHGSLSCAPVHDGAGAFIGIMAAVEDITQRKMAEAERTLLAAAVEQASEVIVVTDPKGVIQYVNPAFSRSTGYERAEALNRPISILKSGMQKERFYQEMWETILTGRVWRGQMVNRRKDGGLFTEEATISPVHDQSGRIVNFVGVKNDITRRMVLEEQLRQSQKMEAIGQLAGGVAHDFNNILQAILGYSDLLLDGSKPGDPRHDELTQIRRSAEKAAQLTRQLLTFSRRQVMQRKVVDLNRLVTDFTRMISRVIGEHIRIEWLPAKDLPPINGDPGMLEQVLMNLSVNARDAMPNGGTLTIRTEEVILGPEHRAVLAGLTPGPHVRLAVSDTGHGVDPAIIERIFEPFFSTKEPGKGTGLGLATVYGVVQLQQGFIDVQSILQQGTTFQVFLPICKDGTDFPTPTVGHTPRGGKETILLAEDEDAIRKLARTILERAGYRVIEACDGHEAVTLFRQHADEIGLVALDVMMPRCTGPEALARIRDTHPRMPAIFATGYSSTALNLDQPGQHGVRLLQKPYPPKTLLSSVREVLDSPSVDYTAPV